MCVRIQKYRVAPGCLECTCLKVTYVFVAFDLYRRYMDDYVGATSSTREELNQFITAVNSFHAALKYTWEISDTSLAFLDIKVSVDGNGLCTSTTNPQILIVICCIHSSLSFTTAVQI